MAASGRPQWTLEVAAGTNDLDYLDVDGDPTAVFLRSAAGPNMFGIDVTTTSATFGQEVPFEDSTCPSSDKWITHRRDAALLDVGRRRR